MRLAFICLLLLAPTGLVFPETFSFHPGERFKVTEKENLRKKVNGSYGGYVYREVRGNAVNQGNGVYDGTFYVFEERTENQNTVNKLESTKPVKFSVDSSGKYVIAKEYKYPRLRNFPVFPAGEIAPGEKWRDYGEVIVDPERTGQETLVRFYCEYTYNGPYVYGGEDGYSFSAQYAVRYKNGDDPDGQKDLLSISGKHVVSIFLSLSGKVFMRDNLEEQYLFSGNKSINYQGFTLTWLGSFAPLNRDKMKEEIKDTVKEQQIQNVTVKEKSEGIAITLENIHFKPDSAEILPGEEKRLSSIAAILKTIPERSFLVTGHTADVGSRESQFELSVKRAKSIAMALSGFGISPGRFIYEGKGGSEPLATNDTEEGRAQNRRVELFIIDG